MSNNHCLHLNLLGSTKKYFLRNRLLPPLLCLLKRVYVTMITLHYFVNMLVCCNLLSLILAMVPPAPKPVESCCFYSIFSQLGPIIETITCTFAAYIQAQTPPWQFVPNYYQWPMVNVPNYSTKGLALNPIQVFLLYFRAQMQTFRLTLCLLQPDFFPFPAIFR